MLEKIRCSTWGCREFNRLWKNDFGGILGDVRIIWPQNTIGCFAVAGSIDYISVGVELVANNNFLGPN